MGPSPGQARARPGARPFFRALARNFEKGPSSTQAWAWLFEKGLENLSFYEVKRRGPSRLGLDFVWRAWAWAWLELDFQGSAWAWSFRARPITSKKLMLEKITLGPWIIFILMFFGQKQLLTNTSFQIYSRKYPTNEKSYQNHCIARATNQMGWESDQIASISS